MGQETNVSLSEGLYISETPSVASEILKGFYVSIPETAGAISEAQLFPVPGLTELTNTGDKEVNRGSHVMADIPYFINGTTLYRLESDLITETPLGTIEANPDIDNARVSTADNGVQLLIVVPTTRIGYIYTVAGGLVQIVDATFTDLAKAAPEICVFIDSYFVINRGSKEFFHSNVNNGLVYGALDFTSAEADPDKIRALHVHKSQLFVLGSETTEVYQTAAGTGAGFAFQRIKGFVIPKGIAAPFSVTEFNGSFVFLGQGVNETAKVYIFTGSGVQAISTTSIDFLLQLDADNISDAFVWNYTFRGAVFVGFSTLNSTLVFDAKATELLGSKTWHLRESHNLQDKNRWRVNSIVTAYDKLLVGDSESGRIGEIDNDVYNDYTQPIVREFALKTLENNTNPIFFNSIQVVVDSGQGLTNGDEPALFMSYSDDARVYTSQRRRGAGKEGEYSKKLRWDQLGMTNRYRIFRFTCSSNTRWVILKVVINVDG